MPFNLTEIKQFLFANVVCRISIKKVFQSPVGREY